MNLIVFEIIHDIEVDFESFDHVLERHQVEWIIIDQQNLGLTQAHLLGFLWQTVEFDGDATAFPIFFRLFRNANLRKVLNLLGRTPKYEVFWSYFDFFPFFENVGALFRFFILTVLDLSNQIKIMNRIFFPTFALYSWLSDLNWLKAYTDVITASLIQPIIRTSQIVIALLRVDGLPR